MQLSLDNVDCIWSVFVYFKGKFDANLHLQFEWMKYIKSCIVIVPQIPNCRNQSKVQSDFFFFPAFLLFSSLNRIYDSGPVIGRS